MVQVPYKRRISMLPCNTCHLVDLVDCGAGAVRMAEAPDLVCAVVAVVWVALRVGYEGP